MSSGLARFMSRLRRRVLYNARQLPYLTPAKLANSFRYKADLRQRRIRTRSFPPGLVFQASAYCNSNCQLCPVGLGVKGPARGLLDVDLFRRVIDETGAYLRRIYFGDWGDPLLHPKIYDMIRHADQNRVETAISTNLHGIKSDEELVRLVDSGLSSLTVSLHGASQETYEAYQPGRILEETLGKLRDLTEIKRRRRTRRPHLELVFTINRKNAHEIESMRALSRSLGAEPVFYSASINLRFHLDDPDRVFSLLDEWAHVGRDQSVAMDGFQKQEIDRFYQLLTAERTLDFDRLDELGLTGRQFCTDPWSSMVINWNGTISLCCVDYDKYVIGDANTQSLLEIWNNDRYQDLRRYLRNRDFDRQVDYPCCRCIRY